MRIILAGIIGRYPWGGVTWCSLMYLLGLRRLGHEVWYLEDTCECNYDPEINALATEPGYALRYISESLTPFGFRDRWCYVDYMGSHHGIPRDRWREICRSADLLLVLSGGVWVWRDEYLAIPLKAFIDSDPAFTQLALHQALRNAATDEKKRWYVDFFRAYDRHFTFGRAIGTPECSLPTGGFHWIPTTQPVCTDLWQPSPLPPRRTWTTVMTWVIESFRDVGGNKDQEFLRVLDLPGRFPRGGGPELELAVNGPRDFLASHGWRCIDAFSVSRDPWRYRDYLSGSRGEFSVAKHTYVATRCGWFSDRTACYLAAGRPAVVQDTGFSRWLPAGEGLVAWTTPEEAVEGLLRVERDLPRHARAARRLAREHLSSERVLAALLDHCTASLPGEGSQ